MRILSIIVVTFLYACTTSSAGDIKAKSSPDNSGSRKVLVELFTSQGCSSCPSADRLVSSLAQSDTNLIILSFHVDYWDRLGWKDVYSNHDYTLRQQQYVQALHVESSYTPQAVVQGQYEMVGSNRNGITNALSKIRENADDVTLTAGANVSGNNITINYDINKIATNQKVIVALVQTHSSTSIARGENSGVQLAGYNVVRNFIELPMQNTGSTQLKLPGDLKEENASVVVFVQDDLSKKIITATQVTL